MPPDGGSLLWCLRGNGRDVRCTSLHTAAGLELRVLWGEELFLTETFRDPDHLEKRSQEFKATLEARGWKPLAEGEAPGETPTPPVPVLPPPSSVHVRRPVHPADACQPAVLVVDDEASIRGFLRRYLGDAGYLVIEADDVDTALDVLDTERVDAVVLDVRLPDPMGWGRTGLEVLAFIRLHAAFGKLPVLVLTGYALDPDERDLIDRHRADLFLKPDGYRMLLERLDQLTRRSAIRH
jgi:CheY-like chemotaxis protein